MTHALLGWSTFLIGQLLQIALQVNSIVQNPSNPVDSRMALLRARIVPFAARLFLCTMGFWFVLENPEGMKALAQASGFEIPNIVLVIMSMLRYPGVSGFVGFVGDSVLSHVPGLASGLPKTD